MARFALFIFLFLGIAFHGYSQTFTLNDSTFQVGDSLVHKVYFGYDGHGLLPESKPFMDSLVVFLQTHDSVQLEIGHHTDYRGNDKYNQKLSEMRCKMIKHYLVYYGKFSESRLTTVGFGESQLLYKPEDIAKIKTKEQQEKTLAKNRRTVFKIISTSYSD